MEEAKNVEAATSSTEYLINIFTRNLPSTIKSKKKWKSRILSFTCLFHKQLENCELIKFAIQCLKNMNTRNILKIMIFKYEEN